MSDIKVGEGYGTDFPHPAAECQTCRGTRQVWTVEPDGSSVWAMACPDCDTPWPQSCPGCPECGDTEEDPF